MVKKRSLWRWVYPGMAVFIGVLGLAWLGQSRWGLGSSEAAAPPSPPPVAGIGGVKLFALWPQDAKPDAVIVLSGETYGLLQPCGCSRPQLGGLERRANFMKGLREKGWPVIGVDLGDLFPTKALVPEQARLRYVTTMKALKEMGYVAVGLGKSEFDHNLLQVLGLYALQSTDPPQILAGNLIGLANGQPIPRQQAFIRGEGEPPTVGLTLTQKIGEVPIGIAGTVGPSLAKRVKDAQGTAGLIDFQGNDLVLKQALAEFAAAGHPHIRLLIYSGTLEEAKKVAEAFPEFHVILCQSEDPEPPQFPTRHSGPRHAPGTQTLIIETGHKGRYVGALGIFKKNNAYELHYQLVPLTEEYLTPHDPVAEKGDRILAMLEDYARQVRDRNMLGKYPQRPHPHQVQVGNHKLEYIGSDKCMGCHAQEYQKWKETSHSHALDALKHIAKRPSLRNYDPECVQCHVVGLGYQTGFETEEKTPLLSHVGCESCHGPGSLHASDPRNKTYLALQSVWKKTPQDRLPDVATLEKMADLHPTARGQVALTPEQKQVMNVVTSMCMRCHDAENDPHFELEKYWPKIAHTFPKDGGLPGLPVKRPGGSPVAPSPGAIGPTVIPMPLPAPGR